jgi:hypothetical protein
LVACAAACNTCLASSVRRKSSFSERQVVMISKTSLSYPTILPDIVINGRGNPPVVAPSGLWGSGAGTGALPLLKI